MAKTSDPAEQLQTLIDRLHAGDSAARDELIGHACDRLRRLVRKLRQDFVRLKRWEDTDDVLQNAVLRLWKALQEVTPRSVTDFFRLAALQIRRELLDLSRHHFGPEGAGANQASDGEGDGSDSTPGGGQQKPDTTHEPSRLAVWTEFHQRVDTLPEEEREVFDLLWYQELTAGQAAALLGVSEATIKRRWLAARRRLHQALKND